MPCWEGMPNGRHFFAKMFIKQGFCSISKVGSVYICKICRISICHYSAYSKRVCIFFDIFFAYSAYYFAYFMSYSAYCLHISCSILHIILHIYFHILYSAYYFADFLAYSAYICPICRIWTCHYSAY